MGFFLWKPFKAVGRGVKYVVTKPVEKTKEYAMKKLLEMLIGYLVDMLNEADMKKFADMALDFVENKIEETPNQWDDKVVGAICAGIRKTFDIPDNDD